MHVLTLPVAARVMNSLPSLAFDQDIFQLQLHGGIRLYFTELSRALLVHRCNGLRLLQPSLSSDVLPLAPGGRGYWLMSGFRLCSLVVSFVSSISPAAPWQSRKIYHATYYRNPLLSCSVNPVVVTVHDLIHECCPEYFDPIYASSIKRYVKAKRRCIFAADAIIAVSYATRDDLLRIYPQLDPSRVHVIHHGSDHFPALSSAESCRPLPQGLPYPRFLLYVGSRGHYKGFDDLLHAFSQLRLDSLDLGLVCVGSQFSVEEVGRIGDLGLTGKVISLQADEANLLRFYQHALGFVYPSWREGFGLPILEAMRARCPVVCSDIPSSREIADHHALFFRARDQQDLLRVLQELLDWDHVRRKGLLSAAQAHASRFTWQDAARRTCDVYLGLLGQHAF